MRIGIDASRANSADRTGTEWYSFEVITRMVRQHPEHHFLLYLKTKPLPDLDHLGSNVTYRILRWPFGGLWNLVRLSLSVMRDRLDVLFVPAHTIPLVHPRKTVTTLHDVGFERWGKLYSQKNIQSLGLLSGFVNALVWLFTFGKYRATEYDYHRWSARFAVRSAAHLITISHFSKNEITSLYHINPERISVVFHGYSLAYQQSVNQMTVASVRKKFSLTRPYIFFIGRLEEKKNIRRILQTFSLLVERGLEHDLVLAGKPGLGFADAYRTISDDIKKRIHTTGWISQADASALMSGATVFFFPSLYEGFGLPVLEAFAANVPVVTSQENSLPEVAGDAALLVNPRSTEEMAATLERVIADTTLRDKLIAAGSKRLTMFSWDRCADETLAILERIGRT